MADIYLAGPMEKFEPINESGNCLARRPVAVWRESVASRAGRNRYAIPEVNEAFDQGHGQIDDYETPMKDINLIRNCDALVAYVDSSERIGTFCEIAAAAALGIPITIVISPLGYWGNDMPWFVERLATQVHFIPKRQEAEWLSMQKVSSALDSDDKREIYQEVIDKLVEVCGGDFTDYQTYIRSDEWRKKASEAKVKVGQRCQICNRHKDEITLDAHHRTYEHLGNERAGDITVLCRDCHELYETAKKNGRVK